MDTEEALRRAPAAEKQLRHEKRADLAEMMAALRRSVEEAKQDQERGYKVGRAAEMIGVHRNTVRGWIERGLLRATRLNVGERGDYLVPHEEVMRAKHVHRVSAEADALTADEVDQYESLVHRSRPETGDADQPSRRQRKAS